MTSKINNVPRLRFPEFSGEWVSEKLKNLTIINQGLQIPISERYENYVDGSYFYITNEFLRKDSKKAYYIKNPPESVICDCNDILMTRTGNTGQVVTNVNGAFHNNFFKIKFEKQRLIKNFLIYFLTHHKTQRLILKLAGSSTIPDLNHGDFYKIICPLPPLQEQQKIADFLSSVDSKIQTLKQKHQLLQQYKKGIMQKLFSQQIRFKDENGEDYPEWENKKINELFVEVKDKVGEQQIDTYSITAGFGFVSQHEKFGRDISSKQNANYIILKPNDFSYNKGNSKTYKYGCVYLNEFQFDIAVPNVFISFRTKKNSSICENFYAQLFKYHYLDRYLRSLISSSARMDGLLNVNKDSFFNIFLYYPCIQEQQKIANFLSSIDQKIDLVSQQIKQTEQFKKGLLQQLFV